MNKLKDFLEKYQLIFAYSILLALTLTIAYIVFSQPQTRTALAAMESKTFDIRQIFLSEHKKTNENIIIVTVDDMSYEYLLENYGDWPIPRYLYGEFLDYVEAQKPAIVAFDFLFISALRNAPNSDEKFIEAINNGKIMLDIRIGVYKSGKHFGKNHDHGTGFRIKESDLECLYDILELRCFENENVVHVDGNIDPIRDAETINLEDYHTLYITCSCSRIDTSKTWYIRYPDLNVNGVYYKWIGTALATVELTQTAKHTVSIDISHLSQRNVIINFECSYNMITLYKMWLE